MAKKIRFKNPSPRGMISEIDSVIDSSGRNNKALYEEREMALADLANLQNIEDLTGSISNKEKAQVKFLQKEVRRIDGEIYKNNVREVKSLRKRLREIEGARPSGLQREISNLKKKINKLEGSVEFGRAGETEIRRDLAVAQDLMSDLVSRSDLYTQKAPDITPRKKKAPKGAFGQREAEKLYLQIYDRWSMVKPHAKKHRYILKSGSPAVHKKYGTGFIVSTDGRNALFQTDEGESFNVGHGSLSPLDVLWIDSQIKTLRDKLRRGGAAKSSYVEDSVTRGDLLRVASRIEDLHNITKPRKRHFTYAESKEKLQNLISRIEKKLSSEKTGKKEIQSLIIEVDEFAKKFPAKMKAEWSKTDQRKWASDLSSVRKPLVRLGRRKNPCVGLHFHGKNADDLLKAVEASNSRQRKKATKKKVAKRNPRTVSRKKGKFHSTYTPSAEEMRLLRKHGMLKYLDDVAPDQIERIVDRLQRQEREEARHWHSPSLRVSNPSKKKPGARDLIKKCRALWDKYCDKPNKTNLKAVMRHLDAMKDSAAKTVAAERKKCMRVANQEAKRLGMKR